MYWPHSVCFSHRYPVWGFKNKSAAADGEQRMQQPAQDRLAGLVQMMFCVPTSLPNFLPLALLPLK
eukprot:2882883-Rhodomonas_salina.2